MKKVVELNEINNNDYQSLVALPQCENVAIENYLLDKGKQLSALVLMQKNQPVLYHCNDVNNRMLLELMALCQKEYQCKVDCIEIQRGVYDSVKSSTRDNASTEPEQKRANQAAIELIKNAIAQGATDIHMQALNEHECQIAFRINAKIQDQYKISSKEALRIIRSLFKAEECANSTLSEEKANRSKFQFKLPPKEYVVRLSHVPDVKGACCFIRIRDPYERVPLRQSGYSNQQQRGLNSMVKHHQGIILFTGENGSGKSTTLTELMYLISALRHFMELGDPIEAIISTVTQVEMFREGDNAKAYTDSILHSVKQNDLDGLVITEVRDAMMANIMVDLALLGQLLMSSFHVGSIIEAIIRLIRLGIDEDLIKSGRLLVGLINQTLIPRLCANCRLSKHPDGTTHEYYHDLFGQNKNIYFENPKGCEKCNHSGVRRPTLVAEALYFDHEVKRVMKSNRDYLTALEDYMWEHKIDTKHVHARRKILSGQLDPEFVESKINPFNPDNLRHFWKAA